MNRYRVLVLLAGLGLGSCRTADLSASWREEEAPAPGRPVWRLRLCREDGRPIGRARVRFSSPKGEWEARRLMSDVRGWVEFDLWPYRDYAVREVPLDVVVEAEDEYREIGPLQRQFSVTELRRFFGL